MFGAQQLTSRPGLAPLKKATAAAAPSRQRCIVAARAQNGEGWKVSGAAALLSGALLLAQPAVRRRAGFWWAEGMQLQALKLLQGASMQNLHRLWRSGTPELITAPILAHCTGGGAEQV